MNDSKNTPGRWNLIHSEPGPELPLFQVRYDLVESPRNSMRMRAIVLETPDWVNIVAVTAAGKIVVVNQYRFGVGKITTEIPAGIVDPGETHQQAAIRELREETGYTASEWQYMGWVEPNAAFLNNRCHHWFASNVTKTELPRLDESEDISVCEMSLQQLRSEIHEGRMRNGLSLLALSHSFDLWNLCA